MKAALFPCYNEDTVRKYHRLLLEESIPDHYRLIFRNLGDRRVKENGIIRCPKCNAVLKLAVPAENSCRLGMYACPVCHKK